jgi:hypothetical protein
VEVVEAVEEVAQVPPEDRQHPVVPVLAHEAHEVHAHLVEELVLRDPENLDSRKASLNTLAHRVLNTPGCSSFVDVGCHGSLSVWPRGKGGGRWIVAVVAVVVAVGGGRGQELANANSIKLAIYSTFDTLADSLYTRHRNIAAPSVRIIPYALGVECALAYNRNYMRMGCQMILILRILLIVPGSR